MKFGFSKINILPLQPVLKFGGDRLMTKEVGDDLIYRITILEDEIYYVHICCPLGDMQESIRNELQDRIEQVLHKQIHLTVTCTHTHYSVKINEDIYYKNLVIKQVCEAICKIQLREVENVSCEYKVSKFDEVGKSRISGYESEHIYLETFSFWEGHKRLFTWIIYNCHPTTLNFHESYLSGAGPNILLKDLEEQYPLECFSYMMGAAGDISTRFTRTGQSYQDMLYMKDKVLHKVLQQLKIEGNKIPYQGMKIEECQFPIAYERKDMNKLQLPPNVSEREKETLQEALNKHKNLSLEDMPKTAMFQRLTIAGHNFIFVPFELFSVYLNEITIGKSSLINCANGRISYLSDYCETHLTFEVISDFVSDQTKKNMMHVFHMWDE